MEKNGTACDYTTPRADIVEDKESFRVFIDMPGVKTENLEILVEDGELVVNGKVTKINGGKWFKGKGVENRNFRRAFSLSEHIDLQKIEATLKDGELTMILPKSETLRPKKIEVKSAA